MYVMNVIYFMTFIEARRAYKRLVLARRLKYHKHISHSLHCRAHGRNNHAYCSRYVLRMPNPQRSHSDLEIQNSKNRFDPSMSVLQANLLNKSSHLALLTSKIDQGLH
jgi:hypothetical protein